jgi:hypothetical protein
MGGIFSVEFIIFGIFKGIFNFLRGKIIREETSVKPK